MAFFRSILQELGGARDAPHTGGTTHISNASIHGIWAMVDADRSQIIKAAANFTVSTEKLNFGGGWEVQNQVTHIANSIGFTKILPGNVIPFQPGGDEDTVYITIFYQERMVDGPVGPPISVCNAYPRNRGHSVTVRSDNCVHPVPYGDLW